LVLPWSHHHGIQRFVHPRVNEIVQQNRSKRSEGKVTRLQVAGPAAFREPPRAGVASPCGRTRVPRSPRNHPEITQKSPSNHPSPFQIWNGRCCPHPFWIQSRPGRGTVTRATQPPDLEVGGCEVAAQPLARPNLQVCWVRGSRQICWVRGSGQICWVRGSGQICWVLSRGGLPLQSKAALCWAGGCSVPGRTRAHRCRRLEAHKDVAVRESVRTLALSARADS
jgi:hypothetical protein